ncbi:MAG: NUDIX hydrolase [Nitrospirae bacterium]|nr:NUDIX hydrolase [Nitrospirota bacterium]
MNLEEKLIRTRVVFEGRYIRTEVRTVQLPDGKLAEREIVIPPNAVAILPIDEQENIYLVRQYRPALGQVILEIPAGIIEDNEDAEETGRRECEEEAGVIPRHMERLCGFHHSVGFSTGRIEIYLATGLIPSSKVHTEEGEFLERVVMPFQELYHKVLAGEIVDSKTVVAALWYKQRTQTEKR